MKIDTIQVGPIMTNCYLLCDEEAKVCALIDPGDESARVARMVDKSGCTLQMILLTHGHYDHYTAIPDLLIRWPDLPVYIHPDDASDNAHELLFPRLGERNQRYYAEGDTLTLGSLTISVLSTPGHSRGSVCLVTGDVIFSGDTLFRFSCGRTDFPGGDWREMLRSLQRLAALPGNYKVYPGHDAPTTLDAERRLNPFIKK